MLDLKIHIFIYFQSRITERGREQRRGKGEGGSDREREKRGGGREEGTEREGGETPPSTGSLLKGPQEPGIDEAKARSLELSLGPLCKHLGHVLMPSQMHQ